MWKYSHTQTFIEQPRKKILKYILRTSFTFIKL